MSESLDGVGVDFEGLVDVVGVQDILSSLFLSRVSVALVQNLLSCVNILLKHLREVDLVDFDVMSRYALVQETRREHHIVSIEPELSPILRIEDSLLPCTGHSAPAEDAGGGEAVDPKTTVVDGSVAIGEETRADGAHHSPGTEAAHPHKVNHSKCSMQRVRAVLPLPNLNSLEEATESTATRRHHVVHEVLEAAAVGEEPRLESLRHFFI